MEQITIKAFIGSNNKTKKLEVDKIISTVNANHEAFTLQYPVIGCWRGETEQTAIRKKGKGYANSKSNCKKEWQDYQV